VIASGSFDELLNSSEEFKQMCLTQDLDYSRRAHKEFGKMVY